MELINKHIINKYIDGQISEDRYLYYIITENNFKVHFISIINECILNDNTVLYLIKKTRYLIEPNDKTKKCYVYDDITKFDLDFNKLNIYNISFDEYLNIFKLFVKYDNEYITNSINIL